MCLAFDFAERLAGGELAFDFAEGVGALLAGDLAANRRQAGLLPLRQKRRSNGINDAPSVSRRLSISMLAWVIVFDFH